jgi:hypothetical protein
MNSETAVFQIIIDELCFLQNEGITVRIFNKDVKLYFVLTSILGDNLGMHSILV